MTGLEAWHREIEAMSTGRVVLVRVETVQPENTLRIAPEFPGRAVVAGLLRQEAFVRQLVLAHALNVNYTGEEGAFHFILLNQARAADWEGMETELLAHEYGHIWLAALGYPSPVFTETCLATAVGDIVQHILIREEAGRRGFDSLAFWKRTRDAWLEREARIAEPPPLDACQRLLLIAEWTDAKLAFAGGGWENRDTYFQLLAARHRALQPVVEDLTGWLGGRDPWDRSVYQSALHHVTGVLLRTL